MTLKEALTTLFDFYGVKVKSGIVTGIATIHPDNVPDKVFTAWQVVHGRIRN